MAIVTLFCCQTERRGKNYIAVACVPIHTFLEYFNQYNAQYASQANGCFLTFSKQWTVEAKRKFQSIYKQQSERTSHDNFCF